MFGLAGWKKRHKNRTSPSVDAVPTTRAAARQKCSAFYIQDPTEAPKENSAIRAAPPETVTSQNGSARRHCR